MEFKEEELVDREKEIALYLAKGFSLRLIGKKTGLSRKLLKAHIRNMMEKLKAADMEMLISIIKSSLPPDKG